MSNKVLNSIRWSITYIFLVPVIVCAVVAWTAFERIGEFESSHLKIAKSTVSTVANEISELIDNQQRLLRLFAKREQQLIHDVAQSPEDESLNIKLTEKLSEFFPEYFAFTLTDYYGNPFIDDFDGYVGALCVKDIKEHAKGTPHLVRLHPNNYFYHIDFMVPWGIKIEGNDQGKSKKGGIFFVSFKPNFVSRLLKLSSPPGHELQLINTQTKNLIEIVETGSRITLKRDDFRLTENEQHRALYSIPVKNSYWELTDFQEKELFSNYQYDIIKFSVIILLVFIAGSIMMTMLLLRSERRRLNAEQTKQEMFSLFNHDLRSPLMAINGFLELIVSIPLHEKDPETYKRLANNAFDNTKVMSVIVDDILDVQKMEAGEMSFEFEDVELISLIQKTIGMNAQQGILYAVKLKLDCELSDIYIQADPMRLIQALTNLLSNAIKYSPKNETVTISVELQGDKVIISVSDKGPGIDKDFRPLIFDKFSQSKSKLTRRVGGTGLGLAIVKYIVSAHNGDVTFVTAIDKGTTFNFSLPR